MNNRAQMEGLGLILTLAIAIIVGTVLLSGSGGIAGQAGTLTSTSGIVNETFTLPAVNAFIDKANCVNLQGSAIVTNATGAEIVPASNYTFTTRISSTSGLKVLTVKTASQSAYASRSVNASYTCLPQGYAEDASTRAVTPLIVLFAALALAAIALGAAWKKGAFDGI